MHCCTLSAVPVLPWNSVALGAVLCASMHEFLCSAVCFLLSQRLVKSTQNGVLYNLRWLHLALSLPNHRMFACASCHISRALPILIVPRTHELYLHWFLSHAFLVVFVARCVFTQTFSSTLIFSRRLCGLYGNRFHHFSTGHFS